MNQINEYNQHCKDHYDRINQHYDEINKDYDREIKYCDNMIIIIDLLRKLLEKE